MSNAALQTRTEAWRTLYPFDSHWIELTAGRMHYVDERPDASNDGPSAEALLFVHGNPTWSFHWRRLIQSLKPRYRCLAPDHLGCGLSDKPPRHLRLNDHISNLAAFIDTLDVERLTLIAQDWGGAIGLGAMLKRPERLKRVVLFNTGAFPPREIPWRIWACRIPFVGRAAVQGANLFSRAALRMTLARRQRLDPAIVSGYLAPYDSWANRGAVYGFVKDIPTGPHDPTWQTLAEIESKLPTLADRPALLVWGMRDWCFRADCLERFLTPWPKAEAHRLTDVGHWVLEDAPDESLAIVDRFLRDNAEEHAERDGSKNVGSTR